MSTLICDHVFNKRHCGFRDMSMIEPRSLLALNWLSVMTTTTDLLRLRESHPCLSEWHEVALKASYFTQNFLNDMLQRLCSLLFTLR